MKKQIIQFVFLASLVVILLSSLFLLKNNKNNMEITTISNMEDLNSIEDSDSMYAFAVSIDDITSFKLILENGDLLSFHKIDNKWFYDYDESLEIDNNKINSVLANISMLEITNILYGIDIEKTGLEDAMYGYSISTDDYVTNISFSYNPGSEAVYAMLNDDAGSIYECDKNVLLYQSSVIEDFLVSH